MNSSLSARGVILIYFDKAPHKALARISSRIVNEVEGINRVTSKPPATIEWE